MRDINFFKPYKSKGGKTRYFYKSLLIILAVAILGSFSINTVRMILLKKEVESYQSKLDDKNTKKQLTLVEENNRESKAVTNYNNDLKIVLSSMETRDVVNNTILDQISSTLPSVVNFKTMNINNEAVSIQGVTTQRTTIGELEHNLKSLDIIDNVHVESISQSGDESLEGEFTFNLKCYLKEDIN